MKKHKQSLRDMWDTIKSANVHIIGVPEGEARENGTEFEGIIAENSPDLMKNTNLYIEETQQTPKSINVRSTSRDIIVKTLKAKDKDKILKARKVNHHVQADIYKTNS